MYIVTSAETQLFMLLIFFLLLLKTVVLQEAASNFNFAMVFDLIALCDR